MKKIHASAKWNELTVEQLEQLEEWLFDERMSYQKALEKAVAEFKFTGSLSSVKRFYQSRARDRVVDEFLDAGDLLKQIKESPTDAAGLLKGVLKLVGRLLMDLVTESPDGVKDWAPILRLMLQHEANEHRREAKEKELELKRERLKLSRQRLETNIIKATKRALPSVQALVKVEQDPEATEFEENIRVNNIRRDLFGPDLPDLQPENAVEAEWMSRFPRNPYAWRLAQEEMAREAARLECEEDGAGI
jgi:hypothetical protein